MLSLRVVFVALAVVCAAQAYAVDYDVSPVETYAGSGLYDKLIDMVEKARQRIKDLDKELKDAIDVAYDKVQTSANKQAELWYLAIQKAVDQANKYGVDVSDCVSENHVLKDIVQRMVTDSRQCIAAERPAVQEVQKELDDLLKEHEGLLLAIKGSMDECKDLPLVQALRCDLGHISKFGGDVARILAHTGKVAAQVAVQTGKSANNIRVCVNGVFLTEGKAAKQVVDKATQCIREKVQGHKQLALY